MSDHFDQDEFVDHSPPRKKYPVKVLVCGGRKFSDKRLLHRTLLDIHLDRGITHIIHGGASGADTLAGGWARWAGVQEVVCPANWDRFGKSAGFYRNEAMWQLDPDLVVAFPGGRGTASMVKIAKDAGCGGVMEVK